MALRHVIEFSNARIEVEERKGYLLVVESGQLRTTAEVARYARAMQSVVTRSGIDRAIIDARGEVGDPPAEVREAMWTWLSTPDRGFSKVAFVLPSEMAIARVNMTALSKRAPLRAFDTVQQATRWLTRSTRSTMTLPALSTAPPDHASDEPRPTGLEPTRVPPAPSVPRDAPPRSIGFRPPAPGFSDQTARSRPSEVRERLTGDRPPRARKTTPPKGGRVA